MPTLSEQVSTAVGALEAASDKAKAIVETDSVITTEAGVRDSLPMVLRKAKEAIAGLGPYLVGTFEVGAVTVTNTTQVVRLTETGDDYRWDGGYPKNVTAGTVESNGGEGVGKWVNIGVVTLRQQFLALRNNIKWSIDQFHVSDETTLSTILTMTTGPIVVRAPVGRFPAPAGNLWRDGVVLIGEQMPHISADGGRLINGTVFTGSLEIFKKNSGAITNCGFDCGPDFVNTGGVAGDGLAITNTLPSEQQTTLASITNWLVDNVAGLCLPASETEKHHGVLLEGMEHSHTGYVVGYNGIASVVVKNKNATCGKLVGYYGDPYTVTIKSNKYAPVENVTVDSILSFGGGGVTIVSDDPTPVGAALKNLTIGSVVVNGGKTGFQGTSTDEQPIDGLTIDTLVVTNASVGAGGFGNGAKSVKIGKHDIKTCANGFAIVGNADVNIGDGSSTGNGQFGYIVSSPNAKAGKIHSEFNGVNGTYITTPYFLVNSYSGSDHHLKKPLTQAITGLLNGINVPSGDTIDPVRFRTYSGGCCSISLGAVKRACSLGDVLLTLPEDIRPLYAQNSIVYVYDGSAFSVKPVTINVDGTVTAIFALTDTNSVIYMTTISFFYR